MALAADVRHEWRQLVHDEPGRRFQNHRDRMQHGSRVLGILRAIVGIALVVAGAIMLVIPGPGLLVIAFGIALLAGMSSTLARAADRVEPALHRWGHRARRRWARLSTPGRMLLVGAVALVALAVLAGAYRVWFA